MTIQNNTPDHFCGLKSHSIPNGQCFLFPISCFILSYSTPSFSLLLPSHENIILSNASRLLIPVSVETPKGESPISFPHQNTVTSHLFPISWSNTRHILLYASRPVAGIPPWPVVTWLHDAVQLWKWGINGGGRGPQLRVKFDENKAGSVLPINTERLKNTPKSSYIEYMWRV